MLRGTTPRTLTAAGFLAVLGFAALLLPLLPIWAQDLPAPPSAGETTEPRRSKKS